MSASCYTRPEGAGGCAGTYNHGPMVTFFAGLYWMEWYNGAHTESVQNRVLFATSSDAITWSPPRVMFNTTGSKGLENEPAIIIEAPRGARRYSVAGSWDVAMIDGNTPLMRRVMSPDILGPVFWLGPVIPKGFEHLNYRTYLEMDAQTRNDAADYLAALVDAVPQSDFGKPSERAMYQLPSDTNRLMLLLRSDDAAHVGQHMLASSCELMAAATEEPPPEHMIAGAPATALETEHFCRPITGFGFNVGLPGDKMPPRATRNAATHTSIGKIQMSTTVALMNRGGGRKPTVGHHCNWSAPVETNIPDSHSRACTARLPDGRVFLVGAQITHGRDPLVLSLSTDGLHWDEAWAVRVCDNESCQPRFAQNKSYVQLPSFSYPAAMWKLDSPRGPEVIISCKSRPVRCTSMCGVHDSASSSVALDLVGCLRLTCWLVVCLLNLACCVSSSTERLRTKSYLSETIYSYMRVVAILRPA